MSGKQVRRQRSLAIVLFTGIVVLTNVGVLRAQKADNILATIRLRSQSIDSNAARYRLVTGSTQSLVDIARQERFAVDGRMGKNGMVNAFFDGSTLRKLVLVPEADIARAKFELYFDDGDLIFARELTFGDTDTQGRPLVWSLYYEHGRLLHVDRTTKLRTDPLVNVQDPQVRELVQDVLSLGNAVAAVVTRVDQVTHADVARIQTPQGVPTVTLVDPRVTYAEERGESDTTWAVVMKLAAESRRLTNVRVREAPRVAADSTVVGITINPLGIFRARWTDPVAKIDALPSKRVPGWVALALDKSGRYLAFIRYPDTMPAVFSAPVPFRGVILSLAKLNVLRESAPFRVIANTDASIAGVTFCEGDAAAFYYYPTGSDKQPQVFHMSALGGQGPTYLLPVGKRVCDPPSAQAASTMAAQLSPEDSAHGKIEPLSRERSVPLPDQKAGDEESTWQLFLDSSYYPIALRGLSVLVAVLIVAVIVGRHRLRRASAARQAVLVRSRKTRKQVGRGSVTVAPSTDHTSDSSQESPAKPPKAELVRLLNLVISGGASELLLIEDHQATIIRGGAETCVTETLTGAQLIAIVKEAAPPYIARDLDENGSNTFKYTSSEGVFEFRANHRGQKWLVSVVPIQLTSESAATTSTTPMSRPVGYRDGFTNRPSEKGVEIVNGEERWVDGFEDYVRGYRDGQVARRAHLNEMSPRTAITSPPTATGYRVSGRVFIIGIILIVMAFIYLSSDTRRAEQASNRSNSNSGSNERTCDITPDEGNRFILSKWNGPSSVVPRIGKDTYWQKSGTCEWNVTGTLGWIDPLSNQPVMNRFRAVIKGDGHENYRVTDFAYTGSYP